MVEVLSRLADDPKARCGCVEQLRNLCIDISASAHADNEVADLHVWRLGPGHFAAIISLVTHHPRDPGHYKALLSNDPELSHITVEVNRCDEACEAGA